LWKTTLKDPNIFSRPFIPRSRGEKYVPSPSDFTSKGDRQTDTQPSSFVTPNQYKSFNFIAFPAPAHVVKSPRRKRETGSELRQGPFTPFPSPTSTFF
jgi:hypothetical protein